MSTLSDLVSELEEPENLSLVLSTVWVILKSYAAATKSPLIVGQYADTKYNHLEQEDIIREVLIRTCETLEIRFLLETDKIYDPDEVYYDLVGNVSAEEYIYHVPIRKDTAIWFLDSIESYKRLEMDLRDERWNYKRNGFFCIVYTGREDDRLGSIRKMFRNLFSLYVLNVNVLLPIGKAVHVYTYFPFTPMRCRDSEPHLIGEFSSETDYKYSQSNFFTRKLFNMWHCSLKVTTWSEPPFIVVEWDNRTGKILHLSGIEGRLLKVISERMNFSMTLKPNKQKDRGYIYQNGTMTGATKMLADGLSDIFINCLMYEQKRVTALQPSYIYLNIPLRVAIPRGRPMTPFERLLKPFQYSVWFCLSSSILIAIILIYVLKLFCKRYQQDFIFGERNRTPFTFFWNILYGVSIHGHLPRKNFARYLLIMWILYTFVLRTAYIGALFIIFRDSSVRTSLTTLDEVVQRDLSFYTFPTLTETLLGASSHPIDMKFVDSQENTLDKLFKRLNDENAKFVVTVLGHIILNFNQRTENRLRQVHFLAEPLIVSPITFYMQKHSYLAFEIDELLLRILAAGLVDRFEEIHLNIRKTKTPKIFEPEKLSLWLLFGVFAIYFTLLLFCSLVFFLEKLSTRWLLLRKIIDFFNF